MVAEKERRISEAQHEKVREVQVIPRGQVGESKWRAALTRRKERLDNQIELKRREDEELEKMRRAAQTQRQMSIMFPKLSREANIKEKQQKVDQLKRERLQLKIKRQADKSEQRTWLYIVKQVKNLQAIAKEEQELEKMRELAAIEEKQRQYKEELEKKRKLKKQENRKWKAKIINQVKNNKAKLEKKRKEQQQNVPILMSRFRKLQREAKKRKQREKLRILREEEKRLQEKKRKQEKELVRRAEVNARLAYARQLQALDDQKRLTTMDELRLKHEAQYAVFEQQKKLMQLTVEQIKQNETKMRQQRELNAQHTLELEKELRRKRELARRVAVSTSVLQYRNRARVLVARRARQLASQEAAWRQRLQHNNMFHAKVRQHWSTCAVRARARKALRHIKVLLRAQDQAMRTRLAEAARREQVARRIARHNVNTPPYRELMHEAQTDKLECRTFNTRKAWR